MDNGKAYPTLIRCLRAKILSDYALRCGACFLWKVWTADES